MPVSRIPNISTKRWIVSHIGKFFGDIIHAFNLDLFSDKGRAKTGKKIYPHTVQADVSDLKNVYVFTRANIFDGDAGEREDKIWAVSDEMVLKSQERDALFEKDDSEKLGIVGTKSDILSVADETEEDIDVVPVSISGATTNNIVIDGIGNTEKAAQIFKASGPLEKITISAKKIGTPIDKLEVKIQEDNGGVPSGTDLATREIDPTDLKTTFEDVEVDFSADELQLDVDKTYWLIFERTGASSADNFYVLESVSGAGDGEYRSFNGTDWVKLANDDTGTHKFPTANNVVSGETAWSNPTQAYSDISDAIFASAQPSTTGEYMRHIWKGFGFTVPADAIISGIELQIRVSQNKDDYGTTIPILTNLTKDADAKVGTERKPTMSTTVTTYTYGNSSDLWESSWTPAEVNDADFGIRLDTENDGSVVSDHISRCQWMSLKIYYYEKYDATNDDHEDIYWDTELRIDAKYLAAYERLYLTTSNDVLFLNGDNGIWQSLWRGILQKDKLDDEYPVILKHLGSGGTLLLANDNKVHTLIATANTPTEADENRLIFDSTHFINWVGVTSSAVFIGLQHKLSELLPSQIVYYEPYAERTRIFTIKEGATIGFIKDENCHILDKSGQIRAFTGTSFGPYQYFPPFFRGEIITKLPHRNGIRVKDDTVSFLWEGQYPDPAGVWVLEDNNLYHKHSLVFDKTNLNSLGAIEVSELGALYQEDELFLGASVMNGSKEDIMGIYSTVQSEDGTVDDEQRTALVTSKFISPEINNAWQDVAIKYDPEGQTGDIVIKYRSEPAAITEGLGASAFNGEWSTAGEFTCSDTQFLADVGSSKIVKGDEVIIRKGQGAGLIAHITDITGSAVTIDDNLAAATSGEFTFSVEKWQKLNTRFRNDRFSHKASLKDSHLEQTQLKLIVKNYILEEIQVLSEVDKTIKKR